ncbi:MAG: YbaK/EbsC family protein, partial [Synergistaceae bacterium]|nr:YbaK/EbsC family protein [Synergistaceae bacterium]
MNPVDKVRNALNELGASDIEIRIVESTIFTVDDAANTIGVSPSEILKSLIFVIDKREPCLI